MAEMDTRQESLEADQLLIVEHGLHDIIEDRDMRPAAVSKIDNDRSIADMASMPPSRVACLPARADLDELAGLMLSHLLQQRGSDAWSAPRKLLKDELLGLLEMADTEVVCISVVEPSTAIHARYLCFKVRAQFPCIKIVIGLWGDTEGASEAIKRLRDSGADEVVVSRAANTRWHCSKDSRRRIGKVIPWAEIRPPVADFSVVLMLFR
jgi:hypothetical protein